jgi:hypothetical protein
VGLSADGDPRSAEADDGWPGQESTSIFTTNAPQVHP